MGTHAKRPSCLVADDHPALLQVVCDVLGEAGFEISGRARDGEEALAKIEKYQPDVALLDLGLPRLSGLEITRRVARSSPHTKIVLYTGNGDSARATEALDAGAAGFLLKESPVADLARALEVVLAGGTYVDPVIAGTLANVAAASDKPTLTQREREVLRLLADGHANEEIGKRLFISAETVRTHVRKAIGKLGVATRTQAVAEALRRSLIS